MTTGLKVVKIRDNRIAIIDIDAVMRNAHQNISLRQAFESALATLDTLRATLPKVANMDNHYVQMNYFTIPLRIDPWTPYENVKTVFNRRIALLHDKNENHQTMNSEGQDVYMSEIERDGLD